MTALETEERALGSDDGLPDQRWRSFPECNCPDPQKGGCRCEDDGSLSHREWNKPRFADGEPG